MWTQAKVNEMAGYFLPSEEAEAFVKSVELGTFSCEALLDACEITDFDTREEITFLITGSGVSPRSFRRWLQIYF